VHAWEEFLKAGSKSSKAIAIAELVSNIFQQPVVDNRMNKVLIFTEYLAECKILHEYLSEQSSLRDVVFLTANGDTKIHDREANLITMNTPHADKAYVMFCTMKCMGQGVNIQEVNHVIIPDPRWNPAEVDQAIARAYRMGQTREVHSYQMFSVIETEPIKTISEKAIEVQKEKRKRNEEVMTRKVRRCEDRDTLRMMFADEYPEESVEDKEDIHSSDIDIEVSDSRSGEHDLPEEKFETYAESNPLKDSITVRRSERLAKKTAEKMEQDIK
jgi:SNF2 family DNA or RNA helicase